MKSDLPKMQELCETQPLAHKSDLQCQDVYQVRMSIPGVRQECVRFVNRPDVAILIISWVNAHTRRRPMLYGKGMTGHQPTWRWRQTELSRTWSFQHRTSHSAKNRGLTVALFRCVLPPSHNLCNHWLQSYWEHDPSFRSTQVRLRDRKVITVSSLSRRIVTVINCWRN